ncbi:DUF3168 domain-containing protein [Neorhizobium sp. JUb45]|uniref:DUF3168 domain-containing protein n=1 Tax=Neorhizobium sp. JUb45 TaxID=2485113 RepID=UPI0014054DE5|nr:DUF3168 domain-containing protein [Neorhizobium sp. JUb45]
MNFQDVLLALLMDSDAVHAVAENRVFDGVPANAAFPYISFGPSDFRLADADCISAREETVQIDCWARDRGRIWPCKKLVDAVVTAVRDLVDDEEFAAERGVFGVRVEMARVFMEADNLTAHGVVQVTASIEE